MRRRAMTPEEFFARYGPELEEITMTGFEVALHALAGEGLSWVERIASNSDRREYVDMVLKHMAEENLRHRAANAARTQNIAAGSQSPERRVFEEWWVAHGHAILPRQLFREARRYLDSGLCGAGVSDRTLHTWIAIARKQGIYLIYQMKSKPLRQK